MATNVASSSRNTLDETTPLHSPESAIVDRCGNAECPVQLRFRGTEDWPRATDSGLDD